MVSFLIIFNLTDKFVLGFEQALLKYRSLLEYGPTNSLSMDVNDMRKLFLNGSCALSIDWSCFAWLKAYLT